MFAVENFLIWDTIFGSGTSLRNTRNCLFWNRRFKKCIREIL